jgi:sodium/potassium-transporting ATPase subunit alpha
VVFDNLEKTVAYLLPAGSFSEFWPVFTNVNFGLPQVLSSFLMIIIWYVNDFDMRHSSATYVDTGNNSLFTDAAAAIALTYESPEADVLLRRPRRPRVDRLVDWKLMLQSYGFIGVIETVCSFSMAYCILNGMASPFPHCGSNTVLFHQISTPTPFPISSRGLLHLFYQPRRHAMVQPYGHANTQAEYLPSPAAI